MKEENEKSEGVQNSGMTKDRYGLVKLTTKPDIELAGLKLWIHDYQYPEIDSGYDANWLMVTACCSDTNSHTWMKEPFLLTNDIEDWIKDLRMHDFRSQRVLELISMENILMINIYPSGNEQVRLEVELYTADHRELVYNFESDMNAVNSFSEHMKKALEKFPVRGREHHRKRRRRH